MLPQKLPLELMQPLWAAKINPVLALPLVGGRVLESVSLLTGTNFVNHGLGVKLQGWFLVRQRSAGSVYDDQDNDLNPALTLKLIASANMVVDIFVF